jgi:hypothetical protein
MASEEAKMSKEGTAGKGKQSRIMIHWKLGIIRRLESSKS